MMWEICTIEKNHEIKPIYCFYNCLWVQCFTWKMLTIHKTKILFAVPLNLDALAIKLTSVYVLASCKSLLKFYGANLLLFIRNNTCAFKSWNLLNIYQSIILSVRGSYSETKMVNLPSLSKTCCHGNML